MTIKTTRWASDVCECIIEFTWDDSLSENERTLKVKNYINRCQAHNEQLPNDTSRFETALEENQRKNKAHADILKNGPTGLYDLDPSGSRQLKSGLKISWQWEGTAPNRILSLSYSGIGFTQTQKAALEKVLSNKFGEGKVKLA